MGEAVERSHSAINYPITKLPDYSIPAFRPLFHPLHTADQVLVHLGRRGVVDAPVPGQHPFEAIVEQPLHRARLHRPRVPAGVAKGDEGVARGRPCEMIAGEQCGRFDPARYSNTWWPRVWPGVGMQTRSAPSATGASPSITCSIPSRAAPSP